MSPFTLLSPGVGNSHCGTDRDCSLAPALFFFLPPSETWVAAEMFYNQTQAVAFRSWLIGPALHRVLFALTPQY